MEKIRLRPSSIRAFMDTPNLWWSRHIEGIEDFLGNTNTYLGTVVHAFAESYYTMSEFNPHAILENAPEEVDKTYILSVYKDMCRELEQKYLSKQPKPELIEYFLCMPLDETFECGGTVDSWDNGILCDYKTAAKQTKKIDDYVNQLHIYAYLLSLTGRKTHTYRIVSIVQPLKTIGARVNIMECKADAEKGGELIKTMHMKSKIAYDNPKYKDYIFNQNSYSFMDKSEPIEMEFTEL